MMKNCSGRRHPPAQASTHHPVALELPWLTERIERAHRDHTLECGGPGGPRRSLVSRGGNDHAGAVAVVQSGQRGGGCRRRDVALCPPTERHVHYVDVVAEVVEHGGQLDIVDDDPRRGRTHRVAGEPAGHNGCTGSCCRTSPLTNVPCPRQRSSSSFPFSSGSSPLSAVITTEPRYQS